jgi:hypothetical protein
MDIRTGGMSVSGQSHSLWNAQPRASSGAFLCGTNPRVRNCPRCGRPKTLLPQCVLGPASAGLFFLKTEADFLEDATVGAARHLRVICRPSITMADFVSDYFPNVGAIALDT